MECSCPATLTRMLYADIQLISELNEKVLNLGSPQLSLKLVTICIRCGRANFSIDEPELQRFRQEQSSRTQ